MRKLDVFNHIWPTRFYEALRAHTSGPMQDITRRSEAVPMMTQLDVRFRVMDRLDAKSSTPEELSAVVRKDHARWGSVIKGSNITVE
jgi:hypothetical protein